MSTHTPGRKSLRDVLRPFAHRGERGETTMSVLIGMVIGLIITGIAVAFLIVSRDSQGAVDAAAAKETSAVSTLNRISKTVGDATQVIEADNSTLVLERRYQSGGATQIERTKFAIESGRLYTETSVGGSETYDPATEWGSTTDRKYLAERVRPISTGVPFFEFETKNGDVLTAGDLPKTKSDGAGQISLVSVNFAALSGEKNGYVSLKSSTRVSTGVYANQKPDVPACPVAYFTQGIPNPIIEWDGVAQTDSYEVYRDGVLIRNISASIDRESYTFTDGERGAGTTPVLYQIIANGEGGRSGVVPPSTASTCPSITWYPRISAPAITAQVLPAAPPTDRSDGWLTQSLTQTSVRISWPAVATAVSYEVYRRKLDSSYNPITNFERVGPAPDEVIFAPTTSYQESVEWDTYYEYYVVANGPMPEASLPSASRRLLTHTRAPSSINFSAVPTDYSRNRVTWSASFGPTANGVQIFRRDNSGCALDSSGTGYSGSTGWKLIATVPLTQQTFADDTAPLSSQLEYRIGATNFGLRGNGTSSTMAGPLSASGSSNVWQYPATPSTSAIGSRGSDDNSSAASGFPANTGQTNTVSSNRVCGASLDRASRIYYSIPGLGNWRYLKDGNAGTHYGIPRASRAYYKVVDYNRTGPSQNVGASDTGADPAYQYPNAPQPATASFNNSLSYSSSRSGYPPGFNRGTYQDRDIVGYEQRGIDSDGDEDIDYYCACGDPIYGPYYTVYYSYTDNFSYTVTPNWTPAHNAGGGFGANWCTSSLCNATVYYTVNGYNGGDDQCVASYSGGCSGRGQFSGEVVDRGDSSVTMRNAGPDNRNTRLCNPGGCYERESVCTPDPATGTCNPPLPIEAPAFRVFGSEGPNPTGDQYDAAYLRRNTVWWPRANGGDTSVSYRIQRCDTATSACVDAATVASGSGSCPAGLPSGATCWSDTGRALGSQTWYRVVAVRGTQVVGMDEPLKPAYQVPPTANTRARFSNIFDATNGLRITQTIAPTASSPFGDYNWTAAVDVGEAAGSKFCNETTAASGQCSYGLARFKQSDESMLDGQWFDPDNNRANRIRIGFPAPQGVAAFIRSRACNPGGCAPSNDIMIDLAPCTPTFNRQASYITEDNRGNRFRGAALTETYTQDPDQHLRWGMPEGCYADAFRMGRQAPADDEFGAMHTVPNAYNGTVATARLVTARKTASGVLLAQQYEQNAAGTADIRLLATPGRTYTYRVWAVSETGRTSEVPLETRFLQDPPKPLFTQDGVFCKPGMPGGKIGIQTYPMARLTFGSTTREIRIDRVKTWQMIGQGDIDRPAETVYGETLASLGRPSDDDDPRWYRFTNEPNPRVLNPDDIFFSGNATRYQEFGAADPNQSQDDDANQRGGYTGYPPGSGPNVAERVKLSGGQGTNDDSDGRLMPFGPQPAGTLPNGTRVPRVQFGFFSSSAVITYNDEIKFDRAVPGSGTYDKGQRMRAAGQFVNGVSRGEGDQLQGDQIRACAPARQEPMDGFNQSPGNGWHKFEYSDDGGTYTDVGRFAAAPESTSGFRRTPDASDGFWTRR